MNSELLQGMLVLNRSNLAFKTYRDTLIILIFIVIVAAWSFRIYIYGCHLIQTNVNINSKNKYS